MSEQWQVDIARSESDRKRGCVEVAAYTSIGFDRRTVARVDRLEDARRIVADHNAALAASTAGEEAIQTLGELKAEILDALEELPRASYGDNETNLDRWVSYINDALARQRSGAEGSA